MHIRITGYYVNNQFLVSWILEYIYKTASGVATTCISTFILHKVYSISGQRIGHPDLDQMTNGLEHIDNLTSVLTTKKVHPVPTIVIDDSIVLADRYSWL